MFILHGPGHDRLAALSIGTGRVAVVLAHQSSGSLCQWWPYARTLADRFRVVAFDFDGAGASPYGDGNYPGEVAAAAGWARDHDSRKIVLMGASMGGTAVVVAAAHLGGSVAGVIDLSGPADFAGMNALGAARRVHVPALFGYGTLDQGFASEKRQVHFIRARIVFEHKINGSDTCFRLHVFFRRPEIPLLSVTICATQVTFLRNREGYSR